MAECAPRLHDVDRYRRHQLTVELTVAGALCGGLAVAGASPWVLAAGLSAVLLPGIRATWLSWVRAGFGRATPWVAAAVLVAVSWQAGVAVLVVSAVVGLVRERQRASPRHP